MGGAMKPCFHLGFVSLACALGVQWVAAGAASAQSEEEFRRLTAPTRDVFEILEDQDAARHIQSGMICPRQLAGMTLQDLTVFPSPVKRGRDVGCDYASTDAAGIIDGKLTIYATDYGAAMPADMVFEATRASIVGLNSAIQPRDGLATFDLNGTTAYFEQFETVMNGVPAETSLSIAVRGLWVIKVRRTKDLPDDPALVSDDPAASMEAMSQALSSIAAHATASE